jgi:hypothetical protein
MPRLLKYGLIASGAGVALCLFGGAGICGPSTTLGFWAWMVGLWLLPIGILLSIAAGVAAIIKRKPKPAA